MKIKFKCGKCGAMNKSTEATTKSVADFFGDIQDITFSCKCAKCGARHEVETSITVNWVELKDEK